MEFAEWVVAGLDQLRLGQLPAGNSFYETASAGLGGDTRLAAYMNSGDPAQRAELVQLIAAAVAANPGFEQQLRGAAAMAQGAGGAGAPDGKPPFLKTTNGLLAIGAAVVVVVGGGIGLAVSGSGGGDLASIMKGTWTCQGKGTGDAPNSFGPVGLTVGDGTWSVGTASGTWTQDRNSATLHDSADPENDLRATGLPSGTGSFDISLGSAKDTARLVSFHIKGRLATHKITLVVPGDDGDLALTCTK
jgi:hypothetical protein